MLQESASGAIEAPAEYATRIKAPSWSDSGRYYPSETCVPELVNAQAAAHPRALAVTYGSKSLTYNELEARANRLAHHLLSLGLQPETPMGLCLGHSIDFVVGALAILKAGGAYLPLDPTYPLERLLLMLKDAGAGVLVTDSGQLPCLADGPWKVVSLDGHAQVIAQNSTAAPAVTLASRDLAYLIYTSGSTGVPKAVEIPHAGLLNLIFWHQRAFDVTAQDRAPFAAAVSFDAAVWEIWPYLTAGASLHLLEDRSIYTAPESLRDWLVENEITIGFIPTPLAERMIHLEWPATTALRLMLTGADTLHEYPSPKLPFRLVNNYGPTESTVVATSGVVDSANRPGILPSIGKPIDNVQIYILNEHLQPVSAGTLGEIYIGGASLARGYRNRPELTAEKFVPDPFSADPEARMYRTGDFGSSFADGQIAFAGRADDQLKIRGHRVEINEIVAVLGRHPAVQSNTVVAQEDEPGNKYLVSYVVARPEHELSSRALREFLRSFLPEYMIPAIFVRLERLPLSAHGKVDRQALPTPDAANTLRDEAFTSPRNALETEVGEIITGLLNTRDLGVHDNFFLLGGSSFLGIQVIARVREKFGVEVPLRALFEAPTIADLSAQIAQLRASDNISA
jgi:amino acid adenylation domain-containing protein